MMQEVRSLSQKILSDTDVLDFLLHYTFSNKFALAAWSLPEDDSLRVILSREPVLLERADAIEDLPAGFLFAPFDRESKTQFLRADLIFTIRDGKLATAENAAEIKSHEWLNDHHQPGLRAIKSAAYLPDKTVPVYDKDHYISMVEKGMAEVEAGAFEKVVPSRSKWVTLPEHFSPVETFLKLRKSYPDAFVSFIASPVSGTWMGASPEELVRVLDKTIFKTIALAGTQPYREGQNLRHVSWTQKEIEEQALVERYIISCFKKIRLREYEEHGPKTVVAGNVMHLRSDFTVNLKETSFPQLGSVMLQLLHPTSAVCGMPLEPSLAFLKAHEGYAREYYSGYLGPVNIGNEINLFVNLRCMQLVKGKAVLYAGAGVTVDSIAEKEWEETEMKMNTLLALIQS